MAMLAMCYDLMEEQMVDKFRAIGIKLGIIKEYEDEDEDDLLPNQNFANGKVAPENGNQYDYDTDYDTVKRTPTMLRGNGMKEMAFENEPTRISVKSRNGDDEEENVERDKFEKKNANANRTNDSLKREASNSKKSSSKEPSILLFKEPMGYME